jgi:DNA-binding SARP family transcriptional activator/nucleoid-associated protein YgaU
MWHIAGRYLGDERRYPEIAELNPEYAHQYESFPDHIQPGDTLVLPDDARDRGERPHATGQVSGEPHPEPPAAPPDKTADPPAAEPGPGADPEDPASATPTPSPPAPSEEGTAHSPPVEPSQEPADAADDPESPPASAPEVGVSLPSGAWVSLGLATLIAAVAMVLRLQQRRSARLSYPISTATGPVDSPVPDSLHPADTAGLRELNLDGEQDSHLPGVVPARPAIAAAVGVDSHGQPISLFDIPYDGLCLRGEGALPAGRAILAAAVSTGMSEHPGARPMVVTCMDTLQSLLPPQTPAVGLDPRGETFDGERLVVTTDVSEAVTNAEEEMIGRRRVLDQLDVDTVGALNACDDHAEHLPPYVLVLTDAGRHAARLRALAARRTTLHLHVVILGQQIDGIPPLHVDADGTFTATSGHPATARLSTLAAADLADVLDLVRHAAPRPEPAPDDVATVTVAKPPTTPGFEIPATPGGQPPPVRLNVLGPVTLETDTGPVTSGVRGRAYAVLALLAAHPKGRTLEEIVDDLHPEDGLKDIRAAVRADINSVRTTLRRTTGVAGKYIAYEASTNRYVIDPELIEVDLWRMFTAIDRANTAVDDETACLAALQEAATCYGGDFAAGQDRAWVIDYATTYRNHILSVYGRIAEILEVEAPDHAIVALEKAIELDPVNEELYQRLMRVYGRQGRADAVRRTLRLLENRLAEIGLAEPSEATQRVALRQLAPATRVTLTTGNP